MFSQRTAWDLRANRLARLLAAKRGRGEAVLDLTESNPTQVGLPYPADLLAPLAHPASLRYEPSPFGLPAAREAVAADFGRRGFPLEPERIVLTAATSEAYAFLFKLLCDPGDEVLVPRPGYPLFEFLAGLESIRVRSYPLVHDGEWHLDLAAVREPTYPLYAIASALEGAEVVREPESGDVVWICNPGNPTGAFIKRAERDGLEALCAERGLALVSDEVFADYAFAEDPRRASSLARDGPALAFSLGGLSKSCGLPQLKLAWIALTGPEAARTEARRRLEVVADTYLSVATPIQGAATELLARREELQSPIRLRTAANLALLRTRLAGGSPATLLDPEGGWYAVLRVPATRSEDERVAGLLEHRNVLVHPGYFFDFPHEAFLVVSLLPTPESFAEGVKRLLQDLVL